jgi:hypothetical protein
MPFKSKAQNAWAHTPAGTKALGGSAKVKEWEGATDYSSLPQHKAQGGVVKPGGNSEVASPLNKGVRTHHQNYKDDMAGGGGDPQGGIGGHNDGHGIYAGKFAQGGEVRDGDTRWTKKEPQGRDQKLGQFLGTTDRFTSGRKDAGAPESMDTEEDWTKPTTVGHTDGDDFGDTKAQPAIKPRKAGYNDDRVHGVDDVKKDPFWRAKR